VGGQCSPSNIVGTFYTSPNVAPGTLTLSNGTCGELVWGGDGKPAATRLSTQASTSAAVSTASVSNSTKSSGTGST